MNVQFPWLTVLTLLPLAAAFLIPVLPDREGKTVRWYALAIALLEFAFRQWFSGNTTMPNLPRCKWQNLCLGSRKLA